MGESTLILNSDLSENVDYNTSLLPIKARYCHQSWYTDKKAPCHWHAEVECIYVLEGSMTYYVNDKTYELTNGDCLFVNANRLHFCQSEQESDCYYMVLLLNPSCLVTNPGLEARFINPVIFDNGLDAIMMHSSGWQKEASALIQEIFEMVMSDEKQYALTIMQDIYAFWNLLYQNTHRSHQGEPNTARMDSLKEMITFVQLHYQKKISLADIAASGMMCESKCCALFKATLHQSPMAYLTAYRIRVSLTLLTGTSKSITDIALSCGFNSGSYYTETFQKLMKMTPKNYRKAYFAQQ